MKKLIFLCFLVCFGSSVIFSQTVSSNFWETNGQVNTTLSHNNKIYIGGDFSYVGPTTGSAGFYLFSKNQTIGTNIKIDGEVQAFAKDNAGNIYIAGDFSVNGGAKVSLVKLNPNFIPDLTFSYTFNGAINKLAINNNSLFLSGPFNTVNGQFRAGFAAIDLGTNTLSSFAPNPDGQIYCLTAKNGNLYVGGSFSLISGSSRKSLAAYNGLKSLLPLNIPVKGSVTALGSIDSLLFIGGNFDSINGIARTNLASINLNTGNVRSWKADVNGGINDFEFANNSVYIAGNFYQVGTEVRTNLASVHVITGLVQSYNPGFDAEVKDISISGTTLFAAGSFRSIGSDYRTFLASIGLTSGSIIGSLPLLGSESQALLTIGDTLIFGGTFSSFGGINASNFAVLDKNTGSAFPIIVDINAPVYDLEMVGNHLLLAGEFNAINMNARFGVAIVDTLTFTPTAWNSQCDGSVYDALVFGNSIYLAGDFTRFGTTVRNRLALVDATTGALYTWNPNLNGTAKKLLLNQAQLYAIGSFTTSGGNARKYIASYDLSNSGTLRSWSLNPNAFINCLATNGARLFIGGSFTSLGTTSRSYLASIDSGNATVSSWAPVISGSVNSIIQDNGLVFIGGDFVSGLAQGFTCYPITSNTELDFPVKLSKGKVNKLNQIGNIMLLGGDFKLANNNGKRNFAVLTLNVNTPLTQASSITISNITPSSMKLNFVKGIGFKHLILARQSNAVDTVPANGNNYTGNAIFGSGQNIGSNFVVYNGSDSMVTITGLNATTTYHFAVFTYNGFSSFTNYLQINPARANQTTIIGYNPPTNPASNIQFSKIKLSSVTVKWGKGNGSARYLVARENAPVLSIPKDSMNYLPSTIFGSGDDIGSGNFVIYNGTGDSAEVSGLKNGTTYHFKVFEYNGISQFRRVLSNAPSNNFTTLSPASEPTISSSNLTYSNVTFNSMQLNWTNGNGASRIVIASVGKAVSTFPVDGTTYQTDNSFNGNSTYLSSTERVVYIGSGNSFTLTGLNPTTTYHFAVIEFNGSNETINYKSGLNLLGSKSTISNLVYPIQPSKNITFSKIGSDSIEFNWTIGNGNKRIVVIRKDNPVISKPEISKNYLGSTEYGKGDTFSDGSYVLLSDIGNSLIVSNLMPKTKYHLAIFEYNNSISGPLYLVDSFAIANVTTGIPAGINGLNQIKFNVFPNPVNGKLLHISSEIPLKSMPHGVLYDLQGKVILNQLLEMESSNNYTFQMDKVLPGTYILNIYSGNQSFQTRITVD